MSIDCLILSRIAIRALFLRSSTQTLSVARRREGAGVSCSSFELFPTSPYVRVPMGFALESIFCRVSSYFLRLFSFTSLFGWTALRFFTVRRFFFSEARCPPVGT